MIKKSEAIELFGTPGKLARVLNVNPNTVSRWPEQLTQSHSDEILGAAVRVKGLAKARVYFPIYFEG